MKIIDQYGKPIDAGGLSEPQTAKIAALQNVYLTAALDGLTPAKLAAALKAADEGDLTAQHRLFADMEERDTHLLAEMGKRKLAVMGLDWDILPPRNATAAETRAAAWVREVLTDAVAPFEDLLLALMDGVGHGFAAVELAWRREGAEWLPDFLPRPQEWFRLDRLRRELRLADASAEGAPLVPFGWVLHTHGTPKTGYLGRGGLYRALVWPFLYKAYALGDFAEFLDVYGLPIVLGKYHAGATADEKASLMRAVTALGHDARAIMPADMQLEVLKVTAEGGGTPHLAMIEWADRAQSKAILGATLTSGVDGGSGNRALGEVHNEVRRDIRDADARQIAGTVTRDLIYPLVALNLGGVDGLRRCPRLVFDTGEPEDIAAWAEALPRLTGVMRIPAEWAHEKLRIPMAQDGEPVLGAASPPPSVPQGFPPVKKGGPGGISQAGGNRQPPKTPAALAALAAEPPEPDPTPIGALTDRLAAEAGPAMDALIEHVRALSARAASLEALRDALLAAYADLPSERLAEVMALGFAVAELSGVSDVAEESGHPPGPLPAEGGDGSSPP